METGEIRQKDEKTLHPRRKQPHLTEVGENADRRTRWFSWRTIFLAFKL
jgi:hypothetical protein